MSKIDLSKAKVGDKFINKDGNVLEFIKFYGGCEYPYGLKSELGLSYSVTNDGSFIEGEENSLDLVVQVLDKGDLLDNNISVEEREQALVEMAKSEREEAKEFDVVIQNLPHIVEQLKEDNPELQRRQEVVELADRIFTEKYLQEWYQYLIDNKTTKTDYVTYIFEWAEKFVNAKDKYLKEGKL